MRTDAPPRPCAARALAARYRDQRRDRLRPGRRRARLPAQRPRRVDRASRATPASGSPATPASPTAATRVLEAAGARRDAHRPRHPHRARRARRRRRANGSSGARALGLHFEVCPSSNVHTGAVASLAEHPIRRDARGGPLGLVLDRQPADVGRDAQRRAAARRTAHRAAPSHELAATDARRGRGVVPARRRCARRRRRRCGLGRAVVGSAGPLDASATRLSSARPRSHRFEPRQVDLPERLFQRGDVDAAAIDVDLEALGDDHLQLALLAGVVNFSWTLRPPIRVSRSKPAVVSESVVCARLPAMSIRPETPETSLILMWMWLPAVP